MKIQIELSLEALVRLHALTIVREQTPSQLVSDLICDPVGNALTESGEDHLKKVILESVKIDG